MTALPTCTEAGPEEVRLALDLLRKTITENPYVPIRPTEPQAVFLTAPVKEILYGGAGGGGKSVAELAGALQYVDQPDYAALLLRRTFADLNLPEALIPLSHQWLHGTAAKWDGQKHDWRFPSGATLTFGYLENENDKYRYQGAAFQYIGFDELTQFTSTQYRYLFSRLRRKEGSRIPLRMRGASNPGGVGHDWVKTRFLNGDTPDRLFVPARLEDNPYLDEAAYNESLAELDPVTRRQMRHGDWDVRPEGELFKHSWFKIIPAERAPKMKRRVRRWDLAATEPAKGKDPDFAAGVLMGQGEDGLYYVGDVRHFRASPGEVETRVRQTAAFDGTETMVRIEQEPGSAGKALCESYARRVLGAYDCRGVPSTGDKVTRCGPFSAACERGDVRLIEAAWNLPFLDELCAFPEVSHDDQVDAAAGAYTDLVGGGVRVAVIDMGSGTGREQRVHNDAFSDRAWTRI